jgi:hypothetical protein
MKQALLSILLSTTMDASPTSIVGRSQVPQTILTQAHYKDVSLILAVPHKRFYDQFRNTYQGAYIGAFYHPINLSKNGFQVKGGLGYFHRKFPTDAHTHLNFQFYARIPIYKKVGLSFSHISNGDRGQINAGMDHISLSVEL